MGIEYFHEDVPSPDIDLGLCKGWLLQMIEIETCTLGDVSIIFCSDSYLLKMNQEYLNHNYYTDIITFDYSEKEFISGDLFISVDTVLSNSLKFKTNFEKELCRVMAHGLLHLMSYNDKNEEDIRIMRQKEDHYLSLLQTIL